MFWKCTEHRCVGVKHGPKQSGKKNNFCTLSTSLANTFTDNVSVLRVSLGRLLSLICEWSGQCAGSFPSCTFTKICSDSSCQIKCSGVKRTTFSLKCGGVVCECKRRTQVQVPENVFKFKLEYYISILPLVNRVQRRRLINGLIHTPIHLISLPRLITGWLGERIALLNAGLAERARGIADERAMRKGVCLNDSRASGKPLWSETQTCRTRVEQIVQVSRRRSERQSKQERRGEAALRDRQRGAGEESERADKRGVMESISPGSDTGNYCNSFCHSPSLSSLVLSLSRPLSSLSQHKRAFHRGVHLLAKALQRLILFVYHCVCVCVSESVDGLCCLCLPDKINEEIHIQKHLLIL